MTIATLSSTVSAPINGAAVRRLFTAWGRPGSRAARRVPAQVRAVQAAGRFDAAPAMAVALDAPARKWPFPPIQPAVPMPAGNGSQQAQSPAPAKSRQPSSDAALGDVRNFSTVQALGMRRMVVDVLLVAVWGALIPAVMWLGAAAGF